MSDLHGTGTISQWSHFFNVSFDFIVLSEATKKKPKTHEHREARGRLVSRSNGWVSGWCFLPPPVICLHPGPSTQTQEDQNFQEHKHQEVKGIGQRRWSDTGELPLTERYLELPPLFSCSAVGDPNVGENSESSAPKLEGKKN